MKFSRFRDNAELNDSLLSFEKSSIVKSYKFGVLYRAEGQVGMTDGVAFFALTALLSLISFALRLHSFFSLHRSLLFESLSSTHFFLFLLSCTPSPPPLSLPPSLSLQRPPSHLRAALSLLDVFPRDGRQIQVGVVRRKDAALQQEVQVQRVVFALRERERSERTK